MHLLVKSLTDTQARDFVLNTDGVFVDITGQLAAGTNAQLHTVQDIVQATYARVVNAQIFNKYAFTGQSNSLTFEMYDVKDRSTLQQNSPSCTTSADAALAVSIFSINF